MEDNLAKGTNDEVEVVSRWVDEVEQVFCSMLSDHQRLHLLVRLISRCSWLLLFQLYRHVVSICEFNFICLLPDCAVYRLLSYLDVKTLLTACQVSKRWNSIISKNQRLWRNVCGRNGVLVPAEPSAEQLADASFSKHLYLKSAVLVDRLVKELPGETISLKGPANRVCSMFFYNGRLVTAWQDNTVCIWNCATGDCLATYSMHSDSVFDIKFDDKFIVTASLDRSASCWDVSNGTRLQTFVHTERVYCVDFNTIINVLVTGSEDFMVNIWSFTDGNLLSTMDFGYENMGDELPAMRVKIWGTHDCFFHIVACNGATLMDYEMELSMTGVEMKDVVIRTAGKRYLSGYHVDGSSLEVWTDENVCSDGLTTVREFSFDCVNSCGRSKLVKRPTKRTICLPYSVNPVNYLTSGACFDVFLVHHDNAHKGRQLYVTGHNPETRDFTIDLPGRAGQHYLNGICVCEDQWMDGLSEEALCNRTLLAVATSDSIIELVKLKSSN